ncbi:MAG: AAA family ATPase, partial [Dehalococcoidia bacterium]
MNCTSCGQENPDGAQFCNRCSIRLATPSYQGIALGHLLDTSSGFVGRHREMGVLRAALADAMSGRGRLVMLVGEPGIGKTRTAQELAVAAETQGAQVLWGRCYEEAGTPP